MFRDSGSLTTPETLKNQESLGQVGVTRQGPPSSVKFISDGPWERPGVTPEGSLAVDDLPGAAHKCLMSSAATLQDKLRRGAQELIDDIGAHVAGVTSPRSQGDGQRDHRMPLVIRQPWYLAGHRTVLSGSKAGKGRLSFRPRKAEGTTQDAAEPVVTSRTAPAPSVVTDGANTETSASGAFLQSGVSHVRHVVPARRCI
jgi:hypothetical protein